MDYSAGAYYVAEAMCLLKNEGFYIDSLVMCYPWTTGLLTKELSSDCPKTLFVLAGEAYISEGKTYMNEMKAVGIAVEVAEYDGAIHSFIESDCGLSARLYYSECFGGINSAIHSCNYIRSA